MNDSLRIRLLDAVIDGNLGRGLIVSRQEFIDYFADVTPSYSSTYLSNTETQRTHSETYPHLTDRLVEGLYRINPAALLARMQERGLTRS